MKKIIVGSLLFLAGCAYNAPVEISPSFSAINNYGTKIKGNYAVFVDSSEMTQDVKVRGYACSAHTYPVDASKSFNMSVYKTLENVIEKVTLVDIPLNRISLKQQNYDGIINIKVDDMRVKLNLIQGFWKAELEGETEIDANIIVEGQERRLLGFSVDGDGENISDAGFACSGGSNAVAVSIEESVKDLLKNIAERISNSQSLR